MNWREFLWDIYNDRIDVDVVESFYTEFDLNPDEVVKEIFSICLNTEGQSFVPEALDKLRGIAPVFDRLYSQCEKPLSTIGGMM